MQYVLFDLLYHAGHCLVGEALARRPEVLADLCQKLDAAEVQFSAGVTGPGMVFFEAGVAHGHEGVMAKHLASSYRPGRATEGCEEISNLPIFMPLPWSHIPWFARGRLPEFHGRSSPSRPIT